MYKNTMAILMALSMVAAAFAFAPSATAVPCEPDTNGNGDPKDDCDAHYTIAGPASIVVKPLFSVGLGFCHNVDPTLALACDNNSLNGAGGFAHPTSPACDLASDSCTWNVWVQWQGQGIGTGGYGVSVCSDRDDSGVCTNVGSDFDDFGFDGYVPGSAILVNPDDKTGDKTGYAHTTFCVRQDHDNGFDDFWGFIFAYADESLVFGTNTGVAIQIGTFDVWVDFVGLDDPNCALDIEDPATQGAKA